MVSDWLVRWTQTGGQITNIITNTIRVTLTKEAKTNSAEITITKSNAIENNDLIFQPGESLEIYAKNNGLIDYDNPSSDDLIGVFTILNFELMPDDSMVKLTCSDLTYNMLANLYTRDITLTDGLNAKEIVFNIVQETKQTGTTQNAVTVNMQSLKSNGGAFSDVTFTSLWKTAYDCITELSTEEYTGDDKPYLFWFEPDGTFNWVYPPSEIDALELNHDTTPVLSMKHSRAESETVNMVIYDAGTDLNDTPILGFYLKPDAGTIKGSIRYQPMTDISKLLKAQGVIVDNNEFVAKANEVAMAQAKRIVQRVGEGIDKVSVDITGRKVNIAKLHKVKSDMKSLNNLRLDRVVHTMNKNGWTTKLELEEDIKTE